MLHAKYVGTELPVQCHGRTALVRAGHPCGHMGRRRLLVQFDGKDLGMFAQGWWDVDALDLVLTRGMHEDSTDAALRRARSTASLLSWPRTTTYGWRSHALHASLRGARWPAQMEALVDRLRRDR